MDFDTLKGVFDAVGGVDGIKRGAGSVSSLLSRKDKATKEAAASGTQPDTGYSPELEKLITMIIEDDEVTDREIEMLTRRAEKEGVDPFEFEIVIKRRLRQKRENDKRLANPVARLIEAFKMAEAAANGDKEVVSAGSLSGALALIPGVGQAAAIGTLAASLIKKPSNLNALKAEIINNAVIPDDERFLADFMLFCQAQRETDRQKKSASSSSLSGMLSSITVGSSLDLIPIWDNKISQLIGRSRQLYPDSTLIKTTIAQVYESPASRLRKLKASGDLEEGLESLSAPEDNQELLDVIAFLYENNDDDMAREAHKKLYKVAERRFADNPALAQKLKTYKIKKFGIF